MKGFVRIYVIVWSVLYITLMIGKLVCCRLMQGGGVVVITRILYPIVPDGQKSKALLREHIQYNASTMLAAFRVKFESYYRIYSRVRTLLYRAFIAAKVY